MNYMGGKHRQGPKITKFILERVNPEIPYFEPFCWAMGVAYRIVPHLSGPVHLSDSNEALVNMWKALFAGWEPPDIISEETYQHHKKIRDPKDPMTAYCGYGVSFGGKWWGGYARNGVGTNFALNTKRSTLLKADFKILCCDYREIKPTESVVYLDPPYAGRVKAYGVNFDNSRFWEYAEELVQFGNQVFVTEFTAPEPWRRMFDFGNTVVGHHGGKSKDDTCESIFIHRSQIP